MWRGTRVAIIPRLRHIVLKSQRCRYRIGCPGEFRQQSVPTNLQHGTAVVANGPGKLSERTLHAFMGTYLVFPHKVCRTGNIGVQYDGEFSENLAFHRWLALRPLWCSTY